MTKGKRRPVSQTLGGIIVGLDYQIFRVGKPPAEMVEAAKPIPPVAASDGGTLEIELPGGGRAPTPGPEGEPRTRGPEGEPPT